MKIQEKIPKKDPQSFFFLIIQPEPLNDIFLRKPLKQYQSE